MRRDRSKRINGGFLSLIISLGLFLALFVTSLGAARAHDRYFNVDSWAGLAIEGFDPVAYFLDQNAVSGKVSLQMEWQGVVWQFSSEHYRDLFQQNPTAYLPEFGGYDAYGMSQGYRANIDPFQWLLTDDALFLFSSEAAKRNWIDNLDGHRNLAIENWRKISKILR